MQSIKPILLEDDLKKEAAKLRRQFPDPRHVDRTVSESGVLVTPAGYIPALFLKAHIDRKLFADAFRIAMTMTDSVEKRSAALGSDPMRRVKQNGRRGAYDVTPDTVMDVLERDNVRQGIFGAVNGTSKRAAQVSKLTRDRPEILDHLRDLCEAVDKLYETYLPTPYALQLAEVKKAPELRLWWTALSSLYIPKNLRCGYHRDSSNLLGTMTALLALGNFSGGELVFPRWRIAIALEPGDVLFFNPQELHGNLVIEGNRASLAAYCARNF